MNDAHETLEPLLSAYLDGELDPGRRQHVAAHLATCALCRHEMEQLQTGDAALASLQPPPPAPDLRAPLRRRLRRQGARTALRGGLLGLLLLVLRSAARDLAIMKRRDLPRWGRLGIASSNVLLVAPVTALCLDLVRDVRSLVEYAWVSDEAGELGEGDL